MRRKRSWKRYKLEGMTYSYLRLVQLSYEDCGQEYRTPDVSPRSWLVWRDYSEQRTSERVEVLGQEFLDAERWYTRCLHLCRMQSLSSLHQNQWSVGLHHTKWPNSYSVLEHLGRRTWRLLMFPIQKLNMIECKTRYSLRSNSNFSPS